jgi:hypothetical protein
VSEFFLQTAVGTVDALPVTPALPVPFSLARRRGSVKQVAADRFRGRTAMRMDCATAKL